MTDRGNLFVIAAPSGTGKTTLVKALVDSLIHLRISISHTTRAKRPHEQEGLHYYFVEKAAFERMIQQGDFLEYATIFDHFYGTSKRWVDETLTQGLDVILEIDWQGQQQIKQLFPDTISIFILPPSRKDLRNRLITRNQDHPSIIERRLADTKEAIAHLSQFDYLLVNDEFQKAVHDLRLIIESARFKQKRQATKYAKLISELSKK